MISDRLQNIRLPRVIKRHPIDGLHEFLEIEFLEIEHGCESIRHSANALSTNQ